MYLVPSPNNGPTLHLDLLSRFPHLTCSCSVSVAFLSLSTYSKVFFFFFLHLMSESRLTRSSLSATEQQGAPGPFGHCSHFFANQCCRDGNVPHPATNTKLPRTRDSRQHLGFKGPSWKLHFANNVPLSCQWGKIKSLILSTCFSCYFSQFHALVYKLALCVVTIRSNAELLYRDLTTAPFNPNFKIPKTIQQT